MPHLLLMLLSLPVCNADGHFLAFEDALFTSCSAVCVTGLVTVVPAAQFNMLGKLLEGRYLIEELIGVGGMANVYKGFDTVEQRTVIAERYTEMHRIFRKYNLAVYDDLLERTYAPEVLDLETNPFDSWCTKWGN